MESRKHGIKGEKKDDHIINNRTETNDDSCKYSLQFNLPILIIERIFDHLRVKDLLRLRETSKKMKSIVDSCAKIWKKRINIVLKPFVTLNKGEKLENVGEKEIGLVENHISHCFDFIYSNENINKIHLSQKTRGTIIKYEIKGVNKKLQNYRKLDIILDDFDTRNFNNFKFLFCNCDYLTIKIYYLNDVVLLKDFCRILKLKIDFGGLGVEFLRTEKILSNASIFTSLRELHLLSYSSTCDFEWLRWLITEIPNLDYLELVNCVSSKLEKNQSIVEKIKLTSLHFVCCHLDLIMKILNRVDLSCVQSLTLIAWFFFDLSVEINQIHFNERIEILRFLKGKCTNLVDFTTNFPVDDFISVGFVFEKPLRQLNFINESTNRVYENFVHGKMRRQTYGIDSIQQFLNKCLTNESRNSLNKMIVEFNLYSRNSDDSDEVISERFSILKSFIIKMFEQLKNLDRLDVYICDCEIEKDAVKSDLTKFKNDYDKDLFCKFFNKNPKMTGRFKDGVANGFVIRR